MEWIILDIAWRQISEEKNQLQSKFDVLINRLKPIMTDLEDSGDIEHWNHSFQNSTNRMDKPEIAVLIGVDGNTADVADELRSGLEAEELAEGNDFVLDASFHPSTMEEYWGKDHLERWAEMKARSSSLAIAAYEGDLGKDLQWHRQQNRPAHIWSNQTGCGFIEEAHIYQNMAAGYLHHTINAVDDEDTREQLEEAKNAMQQSLRILSGGN